MNDVKTYRSISVDNIGLGKINKRTKNGKLITRTEYINYLVDKDIELGLLDQKLQKDLNS